MNIIFLARNGLEPGNAGDGARKPEEIPCPLIVQLSIFVPLVWFAKLPMNFTDIHSRPAY